MSVHKNFIEGYCRNRDKLCNEKILPYQNQIFGLFSEKFHIDAKKDGERGRKLLESRGNKCSEICNEIHLVLGGSNPIDKELKDLVNNTVNLDYNSLLEVFQTLKDKYLEIGDKGVANQINTVCLYLEKMRTISKPHTTIKNQ